MRKRWYFPKKMEKFSCRRWTNQISWRRSGLENIHLDTAAINSRRRSRWFSCRTRRVSSTTSRLVSGCRWCDVSRATHTNLDVEQERRIDDYWIFDESRDLSDSWTEVSHNLLCWKRKLQTDLCGSGGDKRENSWHPGQIIYVQNSGRKWKRSWRRSKSGHMKSSILITSRKLRGIYFIDPEDKEFHEIIKNARKKLETPVARAMPCKIIKSNKNCASGASNKIKTKLACILEAGESTSLRMGESLPNHHEDHIAGKEIIHYSIKIWFTNLFLCLKPWRFQQKKQQWKRNGKNWNRFWRGTWRKSEVKKRWSMKQGRRAQKFILPHWWTSVIWRMPHWRQSIKNTKVELYSEAT